MRTCPECGYVDDPLWRQVPWKFDVDFCHTNDFAKLKPELYKKLKRGHKVVLDECFAYRFSGKAKKAVWRVWRKMYEWGGMSAFNIPMESVARKHDPFQKKMESFFG